VRLLPARLRSAYYSDSVRHSLLGLYTFLPRLGRRSLLGRYPFYPTPRGVESDQQHEALAFLSGESTGLEAAWTTYEKEGYAITPTFGRLDHLLLCEEPRVFTDHRNLLVCYSPSTLDPWFELHKVMKVFRWALFFSQFQYRIEHFVKNENVIAVIMKRWNPGYRGKRSAVHCISYCLLEHSVVIFFNANDSYWPDFTPIREAQEEYALSKPSNFTRDSNVLHNIGNFT